MSTVILSLDQALHNTGYALYDLDKNEFIRIGVIRTEANYSTEERLLFLYKTIEDIIGVNIVKRIYLEEVYCPRNSITAWPILLAVTIYLKTMFLSKGYSYSTIPSSGKYSWRNVLHIGSNKKDAKTFLAPSIIAEHTAEAICIFLACMIREQYISLESIPSILSPLSSKSLDKKFKVSYKMTFSPDK